jgi:hypothetical protein
MQHMACIDVLHSLPFWLKLVLEEFGLADEGVLPTVRDKER